MMYICILMRLYLCESFIARQVEQSLQQLGSAHRVAKAAAEDSVRAPGRADALAGGEAPFRCRTCFFNAVRFVNNAENSNRQTCIFALSSAFGLAS